MKNHTYCKLALLSLLACAQAYCGEEQAYVDFRLTRDKNNSNFNSIKYNVEASPDLPGELKDYTVWVGTGKSVLIKSDLGYLQQHGLDLTLGYSLQFRLGYKNIPGVKPENILPKAPITEGWRTTSESGGDTKGDVINDTTPQHIREMMKESLRKHLEKKTTAAATATMEGDRIIFPITLGETTVQHEVPLLRRLRVYRYTHARVPISSGAPTVGIQLMEYGSPSLRIDGVFPYFTSRGTYARMFGADEITPLEEDPAVQRSPNPSSRLHDGIWVSIVRNTGGKQAFTPTQIRPPSSEDWIEMCPQAVSFATDLMDFADSNARTCLKPLLTPDLLPLKATVTQSDLDALHNKQTFLLLHVARCMEGRDRPDTDEYITRWARDVFENYIALLDETTEVGQWLAPILQKDLEKLNKAVKDDIHMEKLRQESRRLSDELKRKRREEQAEK